MLLVDTEYHWQGFGNGYGKWDSYCRLRIYEHNNKKVVVVSDMGTDTGTSITNSAEHLATLICRDEKLNPDNLIWIEHYPGSKASDETFDFVQFDVSCSFNCFNQDKYPQAAWIFSSPKWSHLGKEKAEELMGIVTVK